jgi:hypothetical protein
VSGAKRGSQAAPVFQPRRRVTFDLSTSEGLAQLEALLSATKGPRARLAEQLATMRAGAGKALSEPDLCNTHEPATRLLSRISTIELAIERGDVLLATNEALLAGQDFTELRVNASLSGPISQVRAVRAGLERHRHKPKPKHDEATISRAMRKFSSRNEQAEALGVSVSTVRNYRRKSLQK